MIVHPVAVDVSGTIFNTTVETLKKVRDSKLADYYRTAEKDDKGGIGISGNPAIFKYVLDYLESDRTVLPSNISSNQK